MRRTGGRPELSKRGATKVVENKLVRVLQMLELIRRRRHGVTRAELREELGIGNASVTRYMQLLSAAGIPIVSVERGDERRLALGEIDREHRPTLAELFVLMSGRLLLQGLEGTRAVAWVDRRLKEKRPPLSIDAPVAHDRTIATAVEKAIVDQKRLEVAYRGAKDGSALRRIIEPHELRFSARAWYLVAFDVDKREMRTFKLARIASAKVRTDPITSTWVAHDPDPHQVGVWQSKDTHDVAVRIFPPNARFAAEYPLAASQHVEPQPDGSVLVRARVMGLYEVTRWVLRWGSAAQVEEPPALRAEVASELAVALGRYGPIT